MTVKAIARFVLRACQRAGNFAAPLAPVVLSLALAGCAGSLQQVQVSSLQPRERAQFLAQVDKTMADAGLRKETPRREMDPNAAYSLVSGFQWRSTGKDSGMKVTWEPHGDWVDLEFPEDGSVEREAVSLTSF